LGAIPYIVSIGYPVHPACPFPGYPIPTTIRSSEANYKPTSTLFEELTPMLLKKWCLGVSAFCDPPNSNVKAG
jgi:hypothetical protein